MLCEEKDYPTGARELHGLVAAGDAQSIIHDLIPTAEAWAKDNGFLFASIASRPAWARLMEPHGYFTHQVYIRKELR